MMFLVVLFILNWEYKIVKNSLRKYKQMMFFWTQIVIKNNSLENWNMVMHFCTLFVFNWNTKEIYFKMGIKHDFSGFNAGLKLNCHSSRSL